MIRLIINLYNEKNLGRRLEFIECLKKNIKCKFIHQIIILNEGLDISEIDNKKIKIINFSNRINFNKFFHIVNNHTQNNDINIISNSDIYFDQSLSLLYNIDFTNTCLALTRWNISSSGNYKIHKGINSQDCWIFQGKIKNVNGSFYLGVPGCDGKIAYELVKAGYKVYNPAYDIKSYHLHQSAVRNYDENIHRLPPPYYYPKFISLSSHFSTIKYRIIHLRQYLNYCYKYFKYNK